jgi:hypothetical protein
MKRTSIPVKKDGCGGKSNNGDLILWLTGKYFSSKHDAGAFSIAEPIKSLIRIACDSWRRGADTCHPVDWESENMTNRHVLSRAPEQCCCSICRWMNVSSNHRNLAAFRQAYLCVMNNADTFASGRRKRGGGSQCSEYPS